ncbi:hypothetical protein P7K49_012073, partial [Saguinus oedipus]
DCPEEAASRAGAGASTSGLRQTLLPPQGHAFLFPKATSATLSRLSGSDTSAFRGLCCPEVTIAGSEGRAESGPGEPYADQFSDLASIWKGGGAVPSGKEQV